VLLDFLLALPELVRTRGLVMEPRLPARRARLVVVWPILATPGTAKLTRFPSDAASVAKRDEQQPAQSAGSILVPMSSRVNETE
jgi:hypothetical protein